MYRYCRQRLSSASVLIRHNRLNRLVFRGVLPFLVAFIFIQAGEAIAHDLTVDGFNPVGTIWLITASSLVFFMNAGFAMLETGLCRTGNAVSVLAKNLIVFCVATLAFWLFGFRFMLGDSASGWVGPVRLLLDFPFPTTTNLNPFPPGFESLRSSWEGRPFAAVFFFQLVFAGTAATIVSGAMAERIKFWAFILFSFVLVGFIYPLTGHWIWGNGWLAAAPIQFRDFAGSTAVHSVGGVAALVGALILQPRKGRFGYDPYTNQFSGAEEPGRFEGYDLSLATLGCLILWLGWFGFNAGSTTNLAYVPHILTTTFFAAAAGGVGAVVFSPFMTDQKARLGCIINGILGGLVGITASSAYVDIGTAVIIGAFSSLLVLWAQNKLDAWKIDDPVGAIAVHFVCGGWGTLAVGIFADTASSEYQIENYSRTAQTFNQAFGWLGVSVTVGLLSLVAWLAVGVLLYAIASPTEKITRSRLATLQPNHYGKLKLPQSIIWLLHITREGIRVPTELEEKGEAPTITS